MAMQQDVPTTIPEIDEDGFMIDTAKWTHEIAEILAKKEILQGLNTDHWMVLDFMREYYMNFGMVPPVRMLARRTGLSLRRIKELFPSGLTKGACKIAGIPRIAIKPAYLYP
ncbi:TusE/DsrC/DsvC family sulfur relay protein [Chloroflexota bacterium]